MPAFNKLHQLAASLDDRAEQLLDAYQAYAVNAVAQLAPVDDGDLQDSVEAAPGDDAHIRRVTVGMEYGKYQEFGTQDMMAQPFVRPGFAALRAPFKRDLHRILKP